MGKSTGYSSKDCTLIYKEINKVSRELAKRDVSDIFQITYKGYSFNCLPFLLNGSGYYSLTFRTSIIDSVSKMNIITEPKSDLKLGKVDNLDIGIFNCVMPAMADVGMRLLCAFLYKHNPREVVRIMYHGAVEVFEDVILNNNMIHFDYKYNKICNTQAFCYYCILLWFLNLSPLLRSLSMREFKRAKFFDLMDSLIPEDTIHFKYIKGEITSKELYKLYKAHSYNDGSSIVQREIMCNSSEGAYTGEDLTSRELSLCNEIYDSYTLNEEYKMNMNLAYCFLYDGTYTRLHNDLSSKIIALETATEQVDKVESKLRLAREELRKLRDSLQERDSLISSLQTTVNTFTYDEDLKSELEMCKKELCKLKDENNRLFNENISQKRLISSQKKQLKQLSSSLVSLQENNYAWEKISEDCSVSLDLQDMISELKDLRIAFVGCDNNAIESKLKDLGFNYVNRVTSTQRRLGKCDILVIFAIRCHHSEVYKAEKMCKGRDIQKLYLSCVNVEQMIKEMYNLMMG